MKKAYGLLAALATVLLLACAPTAPPEGGLPTVRLGLPTDGVIGLTGQYIIEKGIDTKNGFRIEPVWAGPPEVQRLMGIGEIKVGLMTAITAVRAGVQGTPIQLIVPGLINHTFLLVPKDSPYTRVEDLFGKRLGIFPETAALTNQFDWAMRQQGIDIEKRFQLRKGATGAIIGWLERGEVEGALLFEGHVSRLLATGRYRVIWSGNETMSRLLKVENKLFAYIGAWKEWVDQNPDLARKLRAAWLEGTRGVANDPEFFRQQAKKFFGMEKPQELQLGLERTPRFIFTGSWPDSLSIRQETKFLKDAIELGILPRGAEPVIEQLFWRG